MKRTIFVVALVAVVAAFAVAAGRQESQASAAPFPAKPVDLIVAYGAGGGTDITARLLADPLGKELGQPVTVRNITGAGGWTGWHQVSVSPPDGYTIGYVNVPHIFTHYNDPEAGIDADLDSWNFLVLHVADACVWAVRADDTRFNNVQDVISFARANPGQLTTTAHGFGGDEWLAIQAIQQNTGVELDMIHNDSTAESVSQLLGGHVDVLGANVSEVLRYVQSGEMRVLGVMWDSRSEFFSDVPTFIEQGVDVVMFAGRNIATPPGVDPAISAQLQQAVIDATNSPESLAAMRQMGLSADLRSGQELTEFLRRTERMVIDLMGW